MVRRRVKWSYRLATVAGIQVRVHLTFLLLLGFYAWVYYLDGGLKAAAGGVTLTLLIFLCVLLHEFGHAFAAKIFGISTPDITLLPIGGIARLARMPANPWQELAIAIAGPAVNVLIAILLWFTVVGNLPASEFSLIDTAGGMLSAKLLAVNLLLVGFNMIPAFPMDGGRVLRALLATRLRYVAATRLAARVGQVIAVIFVGASLSRWGTPMLAFIGAFVFLGAQQELAHARLREAAQGFRVGQAMITRFNTLPDSLKVAEIAERLAASDQQVFPFVDEWLRFQGLASRQELTQAAQELPPQAAANCVVRRLPTVSPNTSFDHALQLMQESSEPLLPVVNAAGQIVGLVTLAHLAELSALRTPSLSP